MAAVIMSLPTSETTNVCTTSATRASTAWGRCEQTHQTKTRDGRECDNDRGVNATLAHAKVDKQLRFMEETDYRRARNERHEKATGWFRFPRCPPKKQDTTHAQQTQAPYLRRVSVEGRVAPAGKREHDVVEATAADGGALVLGRVDQVLQQARKAVLGAPEILTNHQECPTDVENCRCKSVQDLCIST